MIFFSSLSWSIMMSKSRKKLKIRFFNKNEIPEENLETRLPPSVTVKYLVLQHNSIFYLLYILVFGMVHSYLVRLPSSKVERGNSTFLRKFLISFKNVILGTVLLKCCFSKYLKIKSISSSRTPSFLAYFIHF